MERYRDQTANNKKNDYIKKLKDPRWQKKRLQILERDKWECQICRDTESQLHIHHIKYSDGDPWEIEDRLLVTLCENCHESESDSFYFEFKALMNQLKELGFLSIHLQYLRESFNEKASYKPLDKKYDNPLDILHAITLILSDQGRYDNILKSENENGKSST